MEGRDRDKDLVKKGGGGFWRPYVDNLVFKNAFFFFFKEDVQPPTCLFTCNSGLVSANTVGA